MPPKEFRGKYGLHSHCGIKFEKGAIQGRIKSKVKFLIREDNSYEDLHTKSLPKGTSNLMTNFQLCITTLFFLIYTNVQFLKVNFLGSPNQVFCVNMQKLLQFLITDFASKKKTQKGHQFNFQKILEKAFICKLCKNFFKKYYEGTHNTFLSVSKNVYVMI